MRRGIRIRRRDPDICQDTQPSCVTPHVRSLGRAIVIIALLAVAESLSAQAAGATCGTTVPGGNSQVDEYTETVPGACGHQQSVNASAASASHGDSAPPAPAATVEELRSQGPDGAGAAGLVGDDVEPGSGPGGDSATDAQGSGGPAGGDRSPAASDDGSGNGSALTGLVRSVSGSDDGGGLGVVLPLVLAASLIVALAYLIRRRARTPQT
jgi:hypothetical protein